MKGIAKYFTDGYKRLFEEQSWSLYVYVTSCFAIISCFWLNGLEGAFKYTVMLLVSIGSFLTLGVSKCMLRDSRREVTYTLALDVVSGALVLVASFVNGAGMILSLLFIVAMQLMCRIGSKVERANRDDAFCRKTSRIMLGTLIFGCVALFFILWCFLEIPVVLKVLVPLAHLATVPFFSKVQREVEFSVGEMLFRVEYKEFDNFGF